MDAASHVDRTVLADIGALRDDEIPLAETALLLSASYRSGIDLSRYRHHLDTLAAGVGDRYRQLLDAGARDDAGTHVAALKHVIADQYGYTGNHDRYNDLDNADLVQVIENRKGLPITLGIIAVHAARAQGWKLDGLNFPGHFLLRLEAGRERVIVDPFNGFQMLQAPDLRALIKRVAGPGAELAAGFYEASGNRQMLIRLQNNIKHRQIEGEEYARALATVEDMRLIAPDEYRLLFDSGVLHARTGQTAAAIAVIEDYLRFAARPQDRSDALDFLAVLRGEHG